MASWYDSTATRDESYKKIEHRLRNGSSAAAYEELAAEHGESCAKCGGNTEKLEAHHVRMVNRNKRKNRSAVEQASADLPKILLCVECHRKMKRFQVKPSQRKAKA